MSTSEPGPAAREAQPGDEPPPAEAAGKGRWHDFAPLLISVGFAELWTLLVFRSPTSTYHLMPFVVAAAWPATARILRGQGSARSAFGWAAGGFTVTMVTAWELSAFGKLEGAVLVGNSPLQEAAVVAGLGAVWGIWAASRPKLGLLLGALAPNGSADPGGRPSP